MELSEARLKSLKGRNLFACHEAECVWSMPPRTPRVRCEDNHTGVSVRPASMLANKMDKRPPLDCLRPTNWSVSRKIQTSTGGYKPTLSMVWLSTSATHLPCRCKICWWKPREGMVNSNPVVEREVRMKKCRSRAHK